MPTVTQKLKQEIDLLETAAINSRAQFQRVVKERDDATMQLSIMMASEKAARSNVIAAEQRSRQHTRKLFEIIYRQALEASRLAGYIDRVHILDKSLTEVDQDLGQLVDEQRMRLARAQTDRSIAGIIDGMDSETLDAILGHGAESDDGIPF